MAEITMETDWGAKGAQLTGTQVQDFIKGQLNALITRASTLEETTAQLTALTTSMRLNQTRCGILYNQNKTFRCCKPWEWAAIAAADTSLAALGVVVFNDNWSPLIVAPDEATLPWSMYAATVSGLTLYSFASAYDLKEGTGLTAVCCSTSDGNNGANLLYGGTENAASYAAGYCYTYSKQNNSGGQGITPTLWHLPSVMELQLIRNNFDAINECLAVMSGATVLSEELYWSVCRTDTSRIWCLPMGNTFLQLDEYSAEHKVRPVSNVVWGLGII